MMDMFIHPNPYHLPCHGNINGVYQGWTRIPGKMDSGDSYVYPGCNLTFPGPLLSNKMQKKSLVALIQKKTQECLLLMNEPDQKEAYFFWMIMELFCTQKRKVMMGEIASCLITGYHCLKNSSKPVGVENWCLPLARLLNSAAPEHEHRRAVLEMADNLAYTGQMFAAHICYVIAQLELGTYSDSSFDLIGWNSKSSKSATREAFERSEVYEYVLFLTSGYTQPNFQKYKAFHATMLAEAGLFAAALEYCESTARAVTTSPSSITKALMGQIIVLSEWLCQGMVQQPDWLLNLRWLHGNAYNFHMQHCNMAPPVVFLPYPVQPMAFYRCDAKYEFHNFLYGPVPYAIPVFPSPPMQLYTTPEAVFASRYSVGEPLGQGGFGSVYAGVRLADGKKVAIKYVAKTVQSQYINIPGEMHPLPLEVALMKIASMPPRCENVVELLEWFDMSNWTVMVLELPSPCMDLYNFCRQYNGRLPETVVQNIMRQVLQAACHCSNRGVFHRDIKVDNLLINTETFQVKLIDFGCGELLKDSPYSFFTGTRVCCPPEWIINRQYLGLPATVWSLGLLLFCLLCGDYPFKDDNEITKGKIPTCRDLSYDCCDLLTWCLQKDPCNRATLEDMVRHKWLHKVQAPRDTSLVVHTRTKKPK